MSKQSAIERQLERERAARKVAESLLENKSRELYEANQHLEMALRHLKKQTLSDLKKFEFEELIARTLIHFGRVFLSNQLDETQIRSFLTKLSGSEVVVSTYLRLDSAVLQDLSVFEYGDRELVSQLETSLEDDKSKVFWCDDILHIPINISSESVGELLFKLSLQDINKEFIVNQMELVAELFCSAISRQKMISTTVDARLKAEKSEQSIKEFVAMINHELRTPLNGLLGSAELLSETSLNEQQINYLLNLKSSGDLLRAIINDLLDFSKMSADMMELIPNKFSWEQLESMLTGIFSIRAAEQQIGFVIETTSSIPSHFVGDFERVSQVLVNIVGNAIKFTEKGSVHLGFRWSEGCLSCVVKDTGIGISPGAQVNLFNPFVQADRSSMRHHEGTGLGLAICKQLIELMEGEISFVSEEGVGTTFYISMPLKVSDEGTEVEESIPVAQKPIEQLSILVVDDIRMNQIIINQMLQKLNIEPDISNNGLEALNAVSENTYDMIFMDCRMPEMDGFEATAKLRKQGYEIPIIALTAATTLSERERCVESGMNDILTKPYTGQDLQEMIRKWT